MILGRTPAVLGKALNEAHPRLDNKTQGQQRGVQALENKATYTIVHPALYPGDVEIRIHADVSAATLPDHAIREAGRCHEAEYQGKIMLRGGLYGGALTFCLAGLAQPDSDTAYGMGWVFLVTAAFLGIGTLFMTSATTSARRDSNSNPPSGRTTRSVSENSAPVAVLKPAAPKLMAPNAGAPNPGPPNAGAPNAGAPIPFATNLATQNLATQNLTTGNVTTGNVTTGILTAAHRVQVSKPYLANGRTVLDVRTTPATLPPPALQQDAGSRGGIAREVGMALTGVCIGISAALLGTTALRSDTDYANVAVLLMVAVMVMDAARRT